MMESIDDYLEKLGEPFDYRVDGVEASLTDFDGVAVPTGQGQVFLEWSLDSRDEYRVVLSEDTPGMVEELDLEELEAKLLSGEYTPVQRTETGYRKAEYI